MCFEGEIKSWPVNLYRLYSCVCNTVNSTVYMPGGYLARGVIVQRVYVRGYMSGGYLSGGYLS